jgi:hypothetical protein
MLFLDGQFTISAPTADTYDTASFLKVVAAGSTPVSFGYSATVLAAHWYSPAL